MIFDGKKQTRRMISEVVILSVVFGFAAGMVGQIVADVYLDPWSIDSTQDQDVNQPTVVPELRRTTRFLGIQQDIQVQQALRQNRLSIVGIYKKKQSGVDALSQLYRPTELLGSGGILTSDGWIVTDRSVLSEAAAPAAVVMYRTQAFAVEAVVIDEMTGIIFVKITASNLPVIILGDSDENMAGQLAAALNALGEATVPLIQKPDFQTITKDADVIRSSEVYVDRVLLGESLPASYRGAPLLNLAGEVTGIISAADSKSQLTTAVPINQFRAVILNLLRNQAIRRPYLGIVYLDLSTAPGVDRALSQGVSQGALVYQTPLRQSPAADAGIKVNDIITSVDGQAVDENNNLTKLIQQYQPGDTVNLLVLRDGAQLELEVTLSLLPE